MIHLPIRGYVHLLVCYEGKILAELEGPNLVVSGGKNLIASILSSNSGATPAATQFARAFAFGSGASPVNDGQSVLVSEIAATRFAYTGSPGVAANVLTYAGSITNSSGSTWQIEEVGLFTALAAGTMIARWLSQGLPVPNGATVFLSWSLEIG